MPPVVFVNKLPPWQGLGQAKAQKAAWCFNTGNCQWAEHALAWRTRPPGDLESRPIGRQYLAGWWWAAVQRL